MSSSPKAPDQHRMAHRIVRYNDLRPCRDAFIDTRTPGSDQKENFTIIGPGVSENPNQHVHIAEPHGFNIGGARQPPGCLNSQHSHDTAEVFYVHSGQWRFMSGETAEDGEVLLGPGDLISLPTKLFRGFENVGTDLGFLFAVLGGDDPGNVLWAPQVFDLAEDYGLMLLENGSLVDLAAGQQIPEGSRPMPRTTAAQIAALDRATNEHLETLVRRAGDMAMPLDAPSGVRARRLVGAGALDWRHGFTVTELRLEQGTVLGAEGLQVPEVWFVHSGEIEVSDDSHAPGELCGPGDTLSLRPDARRSMMAVSDAIVVAVRGGDEARCAKGYVL